MVNFMCQLGQTTAPGGLISTELDAAVKVSVGEVSIYNQQGLSKGDHLPRRGWPPPTQLKALERKLRGF